MNDKHHYVMETSGVYTSLCYGKQWSINFSMLWKVVEYKHHYNMECSGV